MWNKTFDCDTTELQPSSDDCHFTQSLLHISSRKIECSHKNSNFLFLLPEHWLLNATYIPGRISFSLSKWTTIFFPSTFAKIFCYSQHDQSNIAAVDNLEQ